MKYAVVTIEDGKFVPNFIIHYSDQEIGFSDILKDDYLKPILASKGMRYRGKFISLNNPKEFMEAFIKDYSSSYFQIMELK